MLRLLVPIFLGLVASSLNGCKTAGCLPQSVLTTCPEDSVALYVRAADRGRGGCHGGDSGPVSKSIVRRVG